MFNNEKYISKGINEKLSSDLISLLWLMIEDVSIKINLDYLQIFKLSIENNNGVDMQKIVHEQEQPKYINTIYVLCDNKINAEIYCIDDGCYSTMIFAEEY